MTWQVEWFRDLDRVRVQLRQDLAAARFRGRVPWRRRATWWAGILAVGFLAGAPDTAIPGVVVFEMALAPRLGTRPRRPLGPLGPWRAPESWRPSPEAPAPMPRRAP